jgi:hypothetical protein
VLYIGCRGSNLFQNFVGELTDIRITNTAVYTTDFVPDQLPTLVAGHTKLLYTPTVDTIYGVDAGDYSLPMKNKSVTYNSDYPQQIHRLTVTHNSENSGATAVITFTAGADAIPVGATMVYLSILRTVTSNQYFNGARLLALDPVPYGSGEGFQGNTQHTFTWYT